MRLAKLSFAPMASNLLIIEKCNKKYFTFGSSISLLLFLLGVRQPTYK